MCTGKLDGTILALGIEFVGGVFALIVVISAILVCDISYDMYAPSLPEMCSYFGVSQTIVQLTVSMNLFGSSVSGLFYGPLSDYHGRKPMMLLGILLFAIASVGCCFANNVIVLIIFRFIQGMGAGVAGVVGYAIVNDVYSGEESAKNLSFVNMVVALSPAIGPVIGSYVIAMGYGWRLIFVFMALGAAGLLLMLTLFKETIQNRLTKLDTVSVIKGYVALLKNGRFLSFALIQSLTIMWVWSSLANLPFIFMEGMHFPVKDYGYLVTISVISYIIGTFVNRRLVGRVSIRNMIITGLVLIIIPDVIVIICHPLYALTPLIIELIWVPSSFGIAFVTSNSMALAFKEVDDKGTASAFLVFIQTVLGAFGIYVAGRFYNGTVIPVTILPIVCSVISIWLTMAVYKTTTGTQTTH
ncbi:multidrug effflux MFS transporter [Anaplasma bovis]|uniref:multidrug effflux MFS transporter n=1 Tax=Anaplasma bovis TaxID=186733 RepID=UPI002FEEB4D0